MERLRYKWWQAAIAMAVFSGSILALAPRYTDVQVAGTTAVFRDAVADVGSGRTFAAAFADMLFVLAYVALAVALLRPNRVSKAGFGAMAVAAAADMIENTLVMVGIGSGDDLTDGFVDLIRSIGVVKWISVIAGGLFMLAGLFLDRRQSR